MCEPICQFAVVRQDNQAGAVLIEPADRVNPLGYLREQVDDTGPAGGIKIRGNVAPRFVDGVVHHRLEPDRLTVDRDSDTIRVDSRSELKDDFAIDGNATLEDQFLACAPRAETGVSQDFLNSLKLARCNPRIAGTGTRRRARPAAFG
jgi:hypothetical protein